MKIEIFEEDGNHTISIDNDQAYIDIDVNPQSKTYRSRMSLKDACYFRTQKYEYRIHPNPIRVETRLIERVDEPPERCSVKDGVVLEANILAEKVMTQEFIYDLKKEVEWHKDWVGNPVSMYLLSLHPEIIPTDNFRHWLRHLSEKIKLSTQNINKILDIDATGLQVIDEYEGSGRIIWYPKPRQDQMSKDEINIAIEHRNKVQDRLFDSKSKEYVGISKDEFNQAVQILRMADIFLNKRKDLFKRNDTLKHSADNKTSIFRKIGLYILVLICLWLFFIIIALIFD